MIIKWTPKQGRDCELVGTKGGGSFIYPGWASRRHDPFPPSPPVGSTKCDLAWTIAANIGMGQRRGLRTLPMQMTQLHLGTIVSNNNRSIQTVASTISRFFLSVSSSTCIPRESRCLKKRNKRLEAFGGADGARRPAYARAWGDASAWAHWQSERLARAPTWQVSALRGGR
ncbi:hypothetical protein K505DRAFT_8931 [Melanomma pulvis-pyrius CBS 109.77]|uniref:Uncharacterized protein n=1 Tax=Melanomma pulvis-pyrius CBS 109.77 TaxID=1314802 RepID=A0A6A6XH05_9PLEO|nr:hypothetical protein K505DRAFT_8931 [Melanomma pulvis-pyrius CBS 109.77]